MGRSGLPEKAPVCGVLARTNARGDRGWGRVGAKWGAGGRSEWAGHQARCTVGSRAELLSR